MVQQVERSDLTNIRHCPVDTTLDKMVRRAYTGSTMETLINTETHSGPDLARLREAYGPSQQEVADRIGVSRAAVAQYEQRAVVPPDKYERCVRAIMEIHREKVSGLRR